MKKITLADLFLKHLSNINSELADQIKMLINSPDVAELLSVAIAGCTWSETSYKRICCGQCG